MSARQSKTSVCLLALLPMLLCAASVEPPASPRYSFQNYGADSGLENSNILSLLQDHAGYIWVGTESGLYRYEGSRFRLISSDKGLDCLAEIRSLTEATDNALWVIACNHLYRSSDGRFQLATTREVVVNSLQGMAADSDGGVFIGGPEGLLHATSQQYPNRRFTVQQVPLPASLQGKLVSGVYRAGHKLWFGCELSLCSLDAEILTRYGMEVGLPPADWDAIRLTAAGDLWVRSAKLTYWRPHGQSRFLAVNGLAPSFSSGYLALASDGSVLIPTTDGLSVIKPNSIQIVGSSQGLRSSLASAVLEDREGSIWIGLLGEGLSRWLGRNEWQSWTRENGLPSNVVWSILRARSDRALWVGTAQGVVRFAAQRPARVWNWAQHVNGGVRWLGEAPDGAIWLTTQGGSLARIDSHSSRVTSFNASDGLDTQRVVRGCFDESGNLWLATFSGLFISRHPSVTARFERVAGSPPHLWDVAEDRPGSFVVTSRDGLWRYRAGNWRRYSRNDGLLTDSEYVIKIAPDGALWLRHRWDGLVERVTFKGDNIDNVSAIKPAGVPIELTALHGFDSLGRYWQGTAKGLSLLADPAAYVKYSDRESPAPAGAWRYYSAEDGLVSNDCDGEAFWADDDGSVWFGTSGGLAHYSPQNPAAPHAGYNSNEPAPVITSVRVSQHPRAAYIEFSSLSFKSEGQARFAYSLDGGNWTDVKERTVTFATLHPGRHSFRVRMRSWGRPWSTAIAGTQFRFEPAWWETLWAVICFYLLAAALVCAVVLLWMRRYRRRVSERALLIEEKARAEAASQAKSLFLANMSHEIRTPLHQIMGLAEDLAALSLPAEGFEITNQLRSSSSGLFALLNGILDFSKLEAGKLELENAPFHLAASLEETLHLYSQAAKDKGVSLSLDCDPVLPRYVLGDRRRFAQVLGCLLSNAIKFTNQGTVRVRAVVLAASAHRCTARFSVTDSGIGMDEPMLAGLFRPFTQGDESRSRKNSGAGLGLIIARSLVLLMGSDELSVQSEPGQGTAFAFSLAFDLADASQIKDSVAPPLPNLSILVVEDNQINQKIMLNMLARMGYRADLAVDGAEAIAAAARHNYDVILMDIQMPRVDGIEATIAIRNQTGKLQPRIYAVTAHATADDRNDCLNAGMDGYLTKPISQELLSRTLAEMKLPEASNAL